MKTAVQSRSTTDVEAVRKFLRLNSDAYDDTIDVILAAAKEYADGYLCNDFLKDDGKKGPIPKTVELWLLRFCSTVFNHPKLAVSSTQTINRGSEELIAVYEEAYNLTIDGLKARRRLPGISTR